MAFTVDSTVKARILIKSSVDYQNISFAFLGTARTAFKDALTTILADFETFKSTVIKGSPSEIEIKRIDDIDTGPILLIATAKVRKIATGEIFTLKLIQQSATVTYAQALSACNDMLTNCLTYELAVFSFNILTAAAEANPYAGG
jgi:hypothetical protein